ncbi:MAG: glycosyltransferase family protein [Chitinophagaceae bacterium]
MGNSQTDEAAAADRDILGLPLRQYDLVVSDFEPISGWACRLQGKKLIGLSHQMAVLHADAPKPRHDDAFGRMVLQHYAPAKVQMGFHFIPLGDNVFTPVIRAQVRQLRPEDKGHYTVYLPAYEDVHIIEELSQFPTVRWEVFSKKTKRTYRDGNLYIRPIENEAFVQSIASSSGVLCGAGFETPAEALFLNKKLMVVPMKGQYEQQCNAACLATMGVPVIDSLSRRNRSQIAFWLDCGEPVQVHYPDNAGMVAERIMRYFWTLQPAGLAPM